MIPETPRIVRFDEFVFDRHTLELWHADAPLRLQQQPARVLAVLTEHAGDLVARETLRRSLWDEDTFVDFERGLNYCVSQIRSALGDSAEAPRYLETLRGRGYRFIAPVLPVENPAVPPRAASSAPAEQATTGSSIARARTADVRPSSMLRFGVMAALLVLLIGGVWSARMVAAKNRLRPAIGIGAFVAPPGESAWSDALRVQLVGRLSAMSRTPIIDLSQAAAAGASPRWIVEGHVDRSASLYRVTVVLRDMRDGSVPWSDIFTGSPGDWVGQQGEMASRMTEAIRYHIEGARAVMPKRRQVLFPD